MAKLSVLKPVVVFGGLALSLTAGAGLASAGPDYSALVNTTCTYPQVTAALNAESPALSAKLNASPIAQATLQNFLASPPPQRQQTIQNLQGSPAAQQYLGTIMQVANTCNNY